MENGEEDKRARVRQTPGRTDAVVVNVVAQNVIYQIDKRSQQHKEFEASDDAPEERQQPRNAACWDSTRDQQPIVDCRCAAFPEHITRIFIQSNVPFTPAKEA